MNSPLGTPTLAPLCDSLFTGAPMKIQQLNSTLLLGLALLGSLVLASCAGYEISLNEQPLGKDKPLFTVEATDDPALTACLQQTVEDAGIATPEELIQLVCSNAGIRSIGDLPRYPAIKQLSLKGNELTAVAAVSQLAQLEYLDVSDNPNLDCAHIALIRKSLGEQLEIVRPDHCK